MNVSNIKKVRLVKRSTLSNWIPYFPMRRSIESILVTGTRRSGTTWLAQTINFKNQYRFVFEPFHPMQSKIWRGSAPPVCIDEENAMQVKILSKIFEGKLRDSWCDQFNFKYFYNKTLVKCVRANVLLPDILERVKNLKIILILRHPFAVALSEKKMQTWRKDSQELVDSYLTHKKILGLCPYGQSGKWASTQDDFLFFIYQWCLENYIALQACLKASNALVVFYEDMVTRPKAGFGKIMNFLGEPFKDEILEYVDRASRSTFNKEHFDLSSDVIQINKELALKSWMSEVDHSKRQVAQEIMKEFKLDCLYGSDQYAPLTEGLQRFENCMSGRSQCG